MLTGVFDNRHSAERAFCAAVELGYEPSDIDLIMSEETRTRDFPGGVARHPLDERSREQAQSEETAAEVGGPQGATAFTVAPALAAVGTVMLIPGILAAGPIAVGLIAAGAVGVAGGLAGALTEWGIPHQRREEYADALRSGAIILGLKPRTRTDARALQREWKAAGGRLIHG